MIKADESMPEHGAGVVAAIVNEIATYLKMKTSAVAPGTSLMTPTTPTSPDSAVTTLHATEHAPLLFQCTTGLKPYRAIYFFDSYCLLKKAVQKAPDQQPNPIYDFVQFLYCDPAFPESLYDSWDSS